MGAHNVDICLKGKKSLKEIRIAFQDRKDSDRMDQEDDSDGYDGDFTTIDEVRFDVLYDGTGDEEKDYELALSKSKKYDYAQAIYTKNRKGDDITYVVGWASS